MTSQRGLSMQEADTEWIARGELLEDSDAIAPRC